MRVILDAGAFLAAERGDRAIAAIVKGERAAGREPLTHGGVVAQVWRGGAGRQAPVARLLSGVSIVPMGEDLGKSAGLLLGASGTRDAVDAAVVALASSGDVIFSSDIADLQALADVANVDLKLVNV